MKASDQKKIGIFVGLLVVMGAVWYFVYRGDTSANTGKKTAAVQKPGKKVKDPVSNTQIDLLGLKPIGDDEVGNKNIFQYRQKPVPPAPPVNRPTAIVESRPPAPPQPLAPYVPPPPPFKNFKYDGFSKTSNGSPLASLTDGTNSFQVKNGECLMGQYCVRQLTEAMIEIEDLQLKQRKSFPRTPPQ